MTDDTGDFNLQSKAHGGERSGRRKLVRFIMLFVGAAILVAAVAATVSLSRSRSHAEKQWQVARSRYLAAQARLILLEQPRLLPRATLLAVESLRHVRTPEGIQALYEMLDLLPQPGMLAPEAPQHSYLSFSPDGRLTAAVDPLGLLHVTEGAGEDRAPSLWIHLGPVYEVSF